MVAHEASERAKQYERLAIAWAKKAEEGHPGAAEMAQTFATLANSARLEHMQWRLGVLGEQLNDVREGMGRLTRKLPER
ncbi:hypothetical protein [Streptomyces prunicolor]|uniref:Uncharacterized protein n=1 Tax=Streptomyces prunicolor TaxID=67348 RepID=A0ABU4FIM2_9ACTN|nr:hypothetical protein [Streptomyces prunicolor]MDV7220424.1 hypothetical protein [Streptomyces prunicolor]